MIFTDKSFAVCVYDNANPLPITAEEGKEIAKESQELWNAVNDVGNANVQAARMGKCNCPTGAPVPPNERPLPGEKR